MTAAKKVSKPLSVTARNRAIAQQTLWAVVSRYSGEIIATRGDRRAARFTRILYGANYCVERLNVRVLGVRP